MIRSATLLILISVIVSSNGCGSKQKKDFPKAELKFPGVKDVAVQESYEDTVLLISSWADNISGATALIPFGKSVDPIISDVSKLKGFLENAKSELGKLVDDNLAIQTVANVQAKLLIIKNQLNEVKQAIKQGRSFETYVAIAVLKCGEILQEFSRQWSHLYKSDNYMLTSPSLVAFAGVFVGVSGFRFGLSPERHTIDEMELLKKVVEMYRDSTVSKRLGYLEIRGECGGRGGCSVHCRDLFFRINSCQSCCKAKCHHSARFTDENDKSFEKYQTEIQNVYTGYFNEPLEKLQKLIQTFEDQNF